MNDWDEYELRQLAQATHGEVRPIVEPRREYAWTAIKLLVVVVLALVVSMGVMAYVAYRIVVFTFWLLALA